MMISRRVERASLWPQVSNSSAKLQLAATGAWVTGVMCRHVRRGLLAFLSPAGNPTREDRIGVCMGIFMDDNVDRYGECPCWPWPFEPCMNSSATHHMAAAAEHWELSSFEQRLQ
jgi:hypothetical protein